MVEKWIQEGVAHCKNSAFEMGVECFNEALALEEKNIQALYNRARALSRLGKLADALKDFQTLTQIQPKNATFIGDYAVALHLNNQNKDALNQFNLALRLEPQNPYRYASRAFYFDRIGKLEESIQDYEKAIVLDPEDAIAMNNKGLVEEKLGYKDKAKRSFDRSNQMMGYDPSKSPSLQTSKNDVSVTESNRTPASPFDNKWEVIKSVFTKDGFKDFWEFSKGILKKK